MLERLRVYGSFLRLPLFGWTLAMVLMGALSTGHGLTPRLIVPILIAIPFQVILGLLNDLADLELDRGDPRKADRPLVNGVIKPSTGKIIVFLAVILSFPADVLLLGFSPARSATLAVAFLATAVYNVVGKRTRVPVLMDMLLGVGSAALLHYSALSVAGSPSSDTYYIEAAVILYITLDNGAHFGVRDINSDYAGGAYTTPIALGVRPTEGAPYLSPRFLAYAFVLQVLLTVVTLGPILVGLSRGRIDMSAAIVAVAFALGSYLFIYPSIDRKETASYRYVSAGLQSLCAFGSLAALNAAPYGGLSALVVFVVLAGPLGARRAVAFVRARTRTLAQVGTPRQGHGETAHTAD